MAGSGRNLIMDGALIMMKFGYDCENNKRNYNWIKVATCLVI